MTKYIYQSNGIPSQEEIDRLMERAQQMRAEYIRKTFAAIPRQIGRLLARLRPHANAKTA